MRRGRVTGNKESTKHGLIKSAYVVRIDVQIEDKLVVNSKLFAVSMLILASQPAVSIQVEHEEPAAKSRWCTSVSLHNIFH